MTHTIIDKMKHTKAWWTEQVKEGRAFYCNRCDFTHPVDMESASYHVYCNHDPCQCTQSELDDITVEYKSESEAIVDNIHTDSDDSRSIDEVTVSAKKEDLQPKAASKAKEKGG